MSTATKLRPNRYAGHCARCGADVPAKEGHAYKAWPFKPEQPWLVRCADEAGCKERQDDRKRLDAIERRERAELARAQREAEMAAAAERAAAKRAAGRLNEATEAEVRAYARMVDRACAAAIPKTVMFDDADDAGWQHGYLRRVAADGSARVYRVHVGPDGETHRERLFDCATEAEAVGRTLRHLAGVLRWCRNKDTDGYRAAAAFLAEHRP